MVVAACGEGVHRFAILGHWRGGFLVATTREKKRGNSGEKKGNDAMQGHWSLAW